MTKQDKENLIKEIDMEIAYQESIIFNNEKLLESEQELTFDRDIYRNSIFAAYNVATGLKIAKSVITSYKEN